MGDIKAIETEYNGYRFRTRLEARWAVFFDAAGIKYVYEQEGLETEDGTRYLPDFFLPELDTHVEVKGKRPGYEHEILKLEQFITWGGPIKQILILTDIPGKTEDGGIWHFPAFYWSADCVRVGWFFFQDYDDNTVIGHVSAAKYVCPNIGEWALRLGKFSIDPKSDYSEGMQDIRGQEYAGSWRFPTAWERNERVAKALLIARQARFEHGETPTVEEIRKKIEAD